MCSEKEVKIVVTPVNDPPVAINDFIEVRSFKKSDPINILANDKDIENDPLVLTTTPVAGPYHGTITMKADGNIEYKSAQGYMGSDSVRYKVCDTGTPSLCDEGVVFIEVRPAPFKIYEGLSPNGDGLNDYWRIDGIEDYPNNTVRVFDRYNNLIFERKGYDNEQNSWTGQANHSLLKGTMPEGTYYYIVDLGDGSDLFKGYVVLKRE
jgi:gliding motility-associated-like protein